MNNNNNNLEKLTEEDELSLYKHAVDFKAKYAENFVFENSSPKHAAIVTSTIFKYAKKSILIFDDNLNGTTTNYESDFYDNVENFLKKGGDLKIVIDAEIKEDNVDFLKLKDLKNNDYKIELYKPSKEFSKEFKVDTSTKIYCTLADNKMYRFETSNAKKTAYCNFNDNEPINGKILVQYYTNRFIKYLENCEPISLN